MVTVQSISLFMFAVTLICWLIPKKIYLGDNSSFIGLVIFTGLSIFFDLFSTYFAFSYILDLQVKEILRKLFLICLVASFYFEFSYLVSKTFSVKFKEKFYQFSIIAPLINTVLISVLPISTKIVRNGFERELEISGLSFYIAYVCAFIYLLAIIFVLIFYGKRINKWYRISFFVSVVLWTCSTVSRLFTNIGGVVSVAISLSLLVMFAIVENPLNDYDHTYRCFNTNKIQYFFDRLCQLKDSNFVLFINIYDLDRGHFLKDRMKDLRHRIINLLSKNKDITVFITEEEEIVVVCNDLDAYDYYIRLVKNEVESFYESIEFKKYFRCITLSLENTILFNYGDELLSYMSIEKEKALKGRGHNIIFNVDEDEVILIKTEDKTKEDIMNAIDEDRVEAFVQPVYSIKEDRIVSAEALCRIRKEDGEYLLPYQFIPIAEKYGLDIAIGCRMTEKVCEIYANPKTKDLFDSIDINLSVGHCEESNMANKIISIANKYNVNPTKLNYEITESGFINKMANIQKNIKSLTDFGFGFSLDDFGNGNSNLNYLVTFPVDYIKLDMHMVWAYFENDKVKMIIRTIIKISHDNNLQVIAEGVETKEQYEELKAQGVDMIQGYYFYKPMPIEKYLELKKD